MGMVFLFGGSYFDSIKIKTYIITLKPHSFGWFNPLSVYFLGFV